MWIDSRIHYGNDYPIASADRVGAADPEKIEMPLLITNLAGLRCYCWCDQRISLQRQGGSRNE
ncbi:hypothetical protein Vqi01_11140 [Micromonospora qiuiae]|uniref:Uncharacterized protein n=1 Tax=Micromonospora qiuiae TaxID=502268 RepID=A0ABQ4J753_9ACTN|nr:hypothetical protein Vqi01_11140 [Micromonospora qiuiae]